MSESGKKIAKWLGIVYRCWMALVLLGIMPLVCLLLAGILGSRGLAEFAITIIRYFNPQFLSVFVFISICMIVPYLLNLKKYGKIWGILVLLSVLLEFPEIILVSCGSRLDAFFFPFVYATPIFVIFVIVRAIQGYRRKEKLVTKKDGISLLILGIICALFISANMGCSCCAGKQAGGLEDVDYMATTPEMQNQVQHDEGVEEGKPEPSVP